MQGCGDGELSGVAKVGDQFQVQGSIAMACEG